MIRTKIVVETNYRLTDEEKADLLHLVKNFFEKNIKVENIYVEQKVNVGG